MFFKGIEDWVHRTGRTGRAGKDGIAHSFFNPNDDEKSAPELVDILKVSCLPVAIL